MTKIIVYKQFTTAAHKNAPETAVHILDKYKREQKIIFGWKDSGNQLNHIKFVPGFPNFVGKSNYASN